MKHSHSATTYLPFAALLILTLAPSRALAEEADKGDRKLKDHLSKLSELVDADAEGMKFRFRTKFNRDYDPDQNNRVLVARKTSNPPILDGILDDDCWKAEGKQDTWKHRTQTAWVTPTTTTPGYKQTVLYVCYDEKNLYLAFVAEEPEPKSVIFGEKHQISEEHWKVLRRGRRGAFHRDRRIRRRWPYLAIHFQYLQPHDLRWAFSGRK